jgi:hypothetical protein
MKKYIKLKPHKRVPKLTDKMKRWMDSLTCISSMGQMMFNPKHYSLTIDRNGWFTAKPRKKTK